VASGDIYVASATAMLFTEDGQKMIREGHTTVREGHPLLKRYPDMFRPLAVDFEVADKPAAKTAAKPTPTPKNTTETR
jgi:hypothetical protein